MEDLLLNLIKEATGSKLLSIRQSAQEAHGMTHSPIYHILNFIIADLLCSQNNLLRNPSHELRSACFLPLRLALETKRSKLLSLALSGLNVRRPYCICL